MKLALAQIDIEPAAVDDNVERALSAIDDAAAEGCDLVVLPEMFAVGYFAFDSYARTAEPLDGELVSTIQARAADRDIAVLAGTFVEDLAASAGRGFETPADEGYGNTAVFVDDEGERRAVYRKHHLFGYGSTEDELLTPGESLEVVDYGGFTIGTTTCYDLRFPELYRDLLDAGATLFLVPSAWPYPRVEHWRVLPRARAIENLAYVAAVNGVGAFEDAELLGRSTLYDPWGTSVAGLGAQSGLVTARISTKSVSERREEFPALSDRRLDRV